ncbi:MAG: APC family permease, partial [Myxococcales bacterium]|nr:APC family permease [Myxococcales bacterium]
AYGMAMRGMLPAPFRVVGDRRRTPWVAAIALTACASLVVLSGDIGFAAHTANFAIFLSFIAVNATVIRLRYTQSERIRPFQIPLSIGRLPVLPLASILGTVALASFSQQQAVLVVLAIVAVGVVLAPWATRLRA